jgi:hypothetical protein
MVGICTFCDGQLLKTEAGMMISDNESEKLMLNRFDSELRSFSWKHPRTKSSTQNAKPKPQMEIMKEAAAMKAMKHN